MEELHSGKDEQEQELSLDLTSASAPQPRRSRRLLPLRPLRPQVPQLAGARRPPERAQARAQPRPPPPEIAAATRAHVAPAPKDERPRYGFLESSAGRPGKMEARTWNAAAAPLPRGNGTARMPAGEARPSTTTAPMMWICLQAMTTDLFLFKLT
ncbi:hypothetical protein ZWY2020_035284 [Hordeum vulgare]|nr:hypothetical protein ZWY2020_035284 [Hordeum vulgare]